MKVADDGNRKTRVGDAGFDVGEGSSRLFGVDGNPHNFRPGLGEFDDLPGGSGGVGGVGVGHGLHRHRMRRAHRDGADPAGDGLAAREVYHGSSLPSERQPSVAQGGLAIKARERLREIGCSDKARR